jgi:hypothetical protein
MAGRVREFLRAHKTDGVGEGLGLAKLEELVQRGEVLASQQRSGIVEKRSSTKRRKNLRRALQSKLLLYLRAVGAVAAKELTMARGMLEKATLHKYVLVNRGMSEQLLGDLAGALGEFEQTIEATRAAQRQHIGASADLEAVAAYDALAGAGARRALKDFLGPCGPSVAGAVPVRGQRGADGGVGQRPKPLATPSLRSGRRLGAACVGAVQAEGW